MRFSPCRRPHRNPSPFQRILHCRLRQVSMTNDHYFGRRIAATGAARVLEAVADPASGASRDENESHG
jgi:hypothetical protein